LKSLPIILFLAALRLINLSLICYMASRTPWKPYFKARGGELGC
jgi:hypothetical protein